MDFDLEVAEFPSFVHQNVYYAARGLTPLERSLSDMDDPALRESCRQYHAFVTDMLSDMYDHPDAYSLPVMMLENFCVGRKINGMKQKYPSKTKNILAQSRNAVHGYMALLYWMGKCGSADGDVLVVSAEDMKEIGKRVNTSVSPIPLYSRLEALERAGLKREGEGFACARYPGMFSAMCSLAAQADKPSGFDFFAFANAEFRNIGKKYKPTHEDYFRPLIADQREQAYALHEFAVGHGLIPTISTFWKVDYKYKGAQVMCVGSAGDHESMLDVRVTCTYNWDDPSLINDRLALTPPEFQKHALRHVWRCNACSTTHLGRFVTVLGKRQRVCGGGAIGFRWDNPTGDDVDAIEAMIRLRMEIIDQNKDTGRDMERAKGS